MVNFLPDIYKRHSIACLISISYVHLYHVILDCVFVGPERYIQWVANKPWPSGKYTNQFILKKKNLLEISNIVICVHKHIYLQDVCNSLEFLYFYSYGIIQPYWTSRCNLQYTFFSFK